MFRRVARLVHQIHESVHLIGARLVLIDGIARKLLQHFDIVAGDDVQALARDVQPRHGVRAQPERDPIGNRHLFARPHRRRDQNCAIDPRRAFARKRGENHGAAHAFAERIHRHARMPCTRGFDNIDKVLPHDIAARPKTTIG